MRSFTATRDAFATLSQTASELGAVAASGGKRQSTECQAAIDAFDDLFGDNKKCNQLENVFDEFEERAAVEQLTSFCVTNKCGTAVPAAARNILAKCRAEFADATTNELREHALALRRVIELSNALNDALCGRTADDKFCLVKLRAHISKVGWLMNSKDETYDANKYYGPTAAPTPAPTVTPTVTPTVAPTANTRKREDGSAMVAASEEEEDEPNLALVAQYMKTGVCLPCFDRTMEAMVAVLRALKQMHSEGGDFKAELEAERDIRRAGAFMVLVRFLCSKDGETYCIDQYNAFSGAGGPKKRSTSEDDGVSEEMATHLLDAVCSNKCLQQFSQMVIATLAPRFAQLALAAEDTAYKSEVQVQQGKEAAEIKAKIEEACKNSPNVEPCKSLCAVDRSLAFCSQRKRQSGTAPSSSSSSGDDDDNLVTGLLQAARIIRLISGLCLKSEGKYCLAIGFGAENEFKEANACQFSATDNSAAVVFEERCSAGSACRAAVQAYVDKVQCCFDFVQWAMAAIEADRIGDPSQTQLIRLRKVAEANAISKWCEVELPEPCKAHKLSFTANVAGIDLCALSAEERRAIALPLSQALSMQLGFDVSVEEVYNGIVRLCGTEKRDDALTLEAGDLADSQCSGAVAAEGTTTKVAGVEEVLSIDSQTDSSVTVSTSDSKCEEYAPESKLKQLERQQAAADGFGDESAASERRAPSQLATLAAAVAVALVAKAVVVA